MRGTATLSCFWQLLRGITPACAGKSRSESRASQLMEDHPRVCGEKPRSGRHLRGVGGSPPRVRGKEVQLGEIDLQDRITPACAGKSLLNSISKDRFWDHPRVCGEKPPYLQKGPGQPGSPPRVRGKADRCDHSGRVSGITPACAGKRLKRSHSIGHFSCILCLFHSVLHRASVSGGSRAGPCAPPCLPAQNAVPV